MKKFLIILLMLPSLIMAQDSIVSGVVFDTRITSKGNGVC